MLNTEELSLPPMPINSHLQETEEILQKHYANLQGQLLDQMDNERSSLQLESNQLNIALTRVTEEKTNMGVALYHSTNRLAHINRSAAQTYQLLI